MAKNQNLDEREQELKKRLQQIEEMENQIRQKEAALKQREKSKKQIVLRLAPALWEEIAKWAEEDFRSINGQIEYLLSECVRRRKK